MAYIFLILRGNSLFLSGNFRLASGLCEDRGLAQALEREGYEVHLLGDCAGVGYIEGAIMDGARIARTI